MRSDDSAADVSAHKGPTQWAVRLVQPAAAAAPAPAAAASSEESVEAPAAPRKEELVAIPLDRALEALRQDRKSLRHYGRLAAFVVFYSVYIGVLFLQRDTRAAWEVQVSRPRP
eukprot:tig00021365_g20817.t1